MYGPACSRSERRASCGSSCGGGGGGGGRGALAACFGTIIKPASCMFGKEGCQEHRLDGFATSACLAIVDHGFDGSQARCVPA